MRANDGAARGAVGAFVSSPHSDRLLAITTGVVTSGGMDAPIYLADEERIVGRVLSLADSADATSAQPAWRMLGLFGVEIPITSMHGAIYTSAYVDDPLLCLGDSVFRRNGQIHRGRITAVDVPIHLRTPGTIFTHGFVGLVEVTSEAGSAFADGSSGGQGVYTESGDLIGLIIGGADNRCFVAPVASLMRRHNLAMADAVAVVRHNGQLDTGFSAFESKDGPKLVSNQVTRFDALNDFMRAIPSVPLFYLPSRHRA